VAILVAVEKDWVVRLKLVDGGKNDQELVDNFSPVVR
tara:strand:- start:31008 stop:31118 length:111 start_codon:yes stop_codon:yes gene_type:complete